MGSMHRHNSARFPKVDELKHRDGCKILLGEGRGGFTFPGPVGSLIFARWQHYLDEGYDEAADSYLNGVLDGIRHRFNDDVEVIIEEHGCDVFMLSDGES